MTTKVKVGDKIQSQKGSVYREVHGECEVLNFVNGYAVLVDGSGVPFTVNLSVVEAMWEKVSGFFQVGKTYTWRNGFKGVTYEVLDLYEVDNPEEGDDRYCAVARGTNSEGGEHIALLHPFDFGHMLEAQ